MLFFEKKAEPISLLPDRFHNVYQFIHISDAAGRELDRANELIAASTADTSITLADEEGLSRWEKILGVSTPLDSTQQSRREALLAKLMTKAPINLAVLKNIIEAYMGVSVEMAVEGYHVDIKYRGESRISDLSPLFVTIYNIIPANMTVSISYKYLVWRELDSLDITFNDLDALYIDWQSLEKGEWIDG